MAGVGIEGAKQAYRTYLGRDPYESETGFINTYAGKTADQLKSIFTSSQEYKSKQSTPSASGGVFDNSNGDLSAFAANQRVETQALLDRQKAEQESIFNQYKTKLGSQETLTNAYGRLRTELGLPDLEGQLGIYKGEIYKTKDLIDRLEENINERTKGSFTNEAQRNRQLAYEKNPLETTLARLGTGMAPIADQISSASNQISTLLNLQSSDQDRELKPYEMQISMLSDRFSREITGFTTSKQTELDALMDKITRGRELADREWQLAQTLAAEEREWARTKEKIKLDASASSSSNSGIASQIAAMLQGNQSGSAGSSTTTSAPTRAGNTDNISYGGKTYSREDFATAMSGSNDRNSSSWKNAYAEILKEFPDYKLSNATGYVSPTAFFGMKG